MADDDRIRRLRAAVLAAPRDDLRKATGRITEETVRALPGPARPLANQLRRSNDPAALLRRLPNPTILAVVADGMTDEVLESTRAILGDAADDPTMEQLRDAVDKVVELFDVATVRVMLAVVAVADAEASDKCDELLATDERFAIPEEDGDRSDHADAGKAGPSEDVLARRKERKEAEKQRKAREREKAKAPDRHKRRPSDSPKPALGDDQPPPAPPVAARRSPTNLPDGFDLNDPLVGTVVIGDVPFEDGVGIKRRPCVVIATSHDKLLVRAGYSAGGVQSRRWQSYELRDWQAAGLDKPSWIEAGIRIVNRFTAGDPLGGRLSDHDWNALF